MFTTYSKHRNDLRHCCPHSHRLHCKGLPLIYIDCFYIEMFLSDMFELHQNNLWVLVSESKSYLVRIQIPIHLIHQYSLLLHYKMCTVANIGHFCTGKTWHHKLCPCNIWLRRYHQDTPNVHYKHFLLKDRFHRYTGMLLWGIPHQQNIHPHLIHRHSFCSCRKQSTMRCTDHSCTGMYRCDNQCSMSYTWTRVKDTRTIHLYRMSMDP